MLTIAAVLTFASVHALVDLRTGELRLPIDASLAPLLAEDPGTEPGGDDALVLGFSAPDLFTSPRLTELRTLSDRLEARPGVAEVRSLATTHDVRDAGGDLLVTRFLDDLPQDPAGLAALRARALGNPMVVGTLLSADAELTVMLVRLTADPEGEAAYAEALDAARSLAPAFDVHVTGKPHLDAALAGMLRDTLVRVVPAAVLLLALVLALAFRRPRGVWVPLVSMGSALLWTLAAAGALGFSLNVVTVTVPPLVLTLAFAYCMHVVSEHYSLARRGVMSARDAVHEAVRAVLVPLTITGITTLAGFLALTLSTVPAIAEFGWLASLGVAASLVAAILLCPALLAILPMPLARAADAPETGLPRLASRISDFDFHNRKAIIATSLAALALCSYGAFQVEVGMNYAETFHEDSILRQDFDVLNERLDGASPVSIALRSRDGSTFHEPAALAAVDTFQRWLATQPDVGGSVSVADYLRILNRAFQGNAPEAFALPESRSLAHQLLMFGGGEDLSLLLDATGQEATVWARVRSQDSSKVAALVSAIETRLAATPELEGDVGGSLVVASHTVEAISEGQVRSLLTALVAIFLVLSAMFTSLRMGLVALLPNVLIVAIYLAALGIAGIPLGPTTSLIGCIALGIAVDDTVHYFARFNHDAKQPVREMPATKSALRSVIRPVSFTSLGLCLGFLTLTASEIQTQTQFGGLAALALAAAWAVDMTLTPALACSVRLVTLWDVLRLDLGRDPTREIGLFEGLSLRAARIVALMGERRVAPRGTEVFKAIDVRNTLIVVTEGELTVYYEEFGQRVPVGRLRRGDVIGHGELFAGPLPLEAEAQTPARMLLFTTETLEGLRRRYPRIGAKIYRNLHRLQSHSMRLFAEWLTNGR